MRLRDSLFMEVEAEAVEPSEGRGGERADDLETLERELRWNARNHRGVRVLSERNHRMSQQNM